MSDSSYTYKYRFYSNSKEIGEMKFLNLHPNIPKADKYKWYIKEDGTFTFLTFVSIDGNKRTFKEGVLEIIDEKTCIYNGEKYTSSP